MRIQQQDARTSPAAHRALPLRGGFSLLEIMVTMTVLGILFGMAYLKLDPRRNQADAGIQVLRTVMEQAMRNSVQRQYNIMVSFDVTGNRVRYVEDINNNNTVDAGERVIWKPLENDMKYAAPPALISGSYTAAPVVGGNLRTIDGMPTVIARRSGALSTDLQVYITSLRAQRQDFRSIIVAQPTGRVEQYRYGGTSWTWLKQ
ncbi:MAG: prepilin-type N-terminal cleavage/methylation domain-containing protein [Gemmatimonadetes bacterium]|nr:prepilin-type N-terminal cleavage/methylation domain-containing protein [Gemmatimonadota bacterium]